MHETSPPADTRVSTISLRHPIAQHLPHMHLVVQVTKVTTVRTLQLDSHASALTFNITSTTHNIFLTFAHSDLEI